VTPHGSTGGKKDVMAVIIPRRADDSARG
jgi:hypothetical protein